MRMHKYWTLNFDPYTFIDNIVIEIFSDDGYCYK